MPTYTNQPDATDGIDTTMFDSVPTTNYATRPTLDIGELSGVAQIGRSLWKNDFTKGTNPPTADAIVTSATLYLYNDSGDSANSNRVMDVFRVLRNWTEAGATWNTYDGSNNWGTAGCANTSNDRDNVSLGSTTWVNGEAVGTEHAISLDVATVQGWIRGTISNYGLLLKMQTETDDAFFPGSSDNATAGYRPKLVVEWNTGGFFLFMGV